MIITFLSDLGISDATVAAAKAAMSRHVPGAVIIDISHHVTQYDVQQAAYLLLSAYSHFPAGTVHVAAIEVFSGNSPRMLVAAYEEHYFVVPDNGLLQLAFREKLSTAGVAYTLRQPHSFADWTDNAGKIIAAINAGDTAQYEPLQLKPMPRTLNMQSMPHAIDCNVLYVDRYGNVVLDITKEEFHDVVRDRPFKIKMPRMQDMTAVSDNYNNVPEGGALCRFNMAGYLEIAINHGTAATQLGLDPYKTGNLRYKNIRIFL
ncbi:MAG: SAM-dependent chlorinase/fluorinase [Bacteroidota bacterium]